MTKRKTIQKDLVLNAVLFLKSHVTADEVYEFIIKDHPSVGRATVYRNLAILAEEGKIRKVEIPDGPDRYDFILKDHYHVECIYCQKLFDVDMDTLPGLIDSIKDKHGIDFLEYEILFKGVCPNCKKTHVEEK